MIILDDMQSCYGCGACFNACPVGAIDMRENTEGFLEPVIDESKCISCGKCKQVCPSINRQYPNDPEPDMYAFSAEEKILHDSSSGGIFTFLAEHILRAGGYVVGAAYDSQYYVNHTIIHSVDGLDKIRRSKYLQSATGSTFHRTKELLEAGESVLYSGCPCQIAGLLRFLGRDYDQLYTVDLLCHGVPSPRLFQEHLRNTYGGIQKIEDVEFRSREGWASLFRVKLRNGKTRTAYNNNSVYMQSFLRDINLRASCFQCQYSRLPRQGDVTIGDLWAAANCGLSFDYRKGVSVVLLNNEKGSALFRDALSKPKYQFHVQKIHGRDVEKPCDTKWLNANIFHPVTSGNVARQKKFFSDCSSMGFERAVHQTLHKFDVGLMLYLGDNYGSIATNYALYNTISGMGRSVAVLDHLVISGNEVLKFARKHMKLCSSFLERDDEQGTNQCFDTFVTGSDIAWDWVMNPDRPLPLMMLGFAGQDKRIISYAPSLGAKKGAANITEPERSLYSHYLERYDAISVREDYGVDMCRDLFCVEAAQVLDPVLLCGRDVWDKLSDTSQLKFDGEYLLAYILDPDPNKRKAVLETAKKLNMRAVVILDQTLNYQGNKKRMNMDESIVRPEFAGWLAYFRHASYVITDSFHGACFSLIYGKKFAAIKNRSKGRFDSLARLTGCPFLFFENSAQLLQKPDLFPDLDYDSVHRRMELSRMESEKWLRSALDVEIKPKTSSDSAKLLYQYFLSLRDTRNRLNRTVREYAYEAAQKSEIETAMRAGRTWMDIVHAKNGITPGTSALREIGSLRDYFSALRASPKYVIILSGRNECSTYFGKFLEITGLPLRKDVVWRNSYVAVMDGETVKIDEKSTEEINVNYEFIAGHPKYSVEYLNNRLNFSCMPLKCCGIRIKSKGFVEPTGASKSEIVIDNIDYSMNRVGLNIVVIDKETGDIADSISVNTYSDSGLKINR